VAIAAGQELGLDAEVMRRSLKELQWASRLEIISQKPMIVLDGAHNEEGMLALKKTLESLWPDKHITLLIGMLSNKEWEKCSNILWPFVDKVIVTRPPYGNTKDWVKLAERAEKVGKIVRVESNVPRAFEKALSMTGPDEMLLVTGSLYMTAVARRYYLSDDYEKTQQLPLMLASRSPRRLELLSQIGIRPSVFSSSVKEEREGEDPAELVVKNALAKAKDVASRQERGLVLGADTIVCRDGQIFGKPANSREAAKMLAALSDGRHSVYTGVAVVDADSGRVETGCQETGVWFRPLSRDEIAMYLCDAEYKDKAGAYGIQGRAALFIDRIEGDYSNVVGLQLPLLRDLLLKWEIDILQKTE
jgi:septum formation protein